MRQEKTKENLKYTLIILLVFVLFALVIALKYKKDMKEYSPDKLEAFLEESLGQDVSVEADIWNYVCDSVTGDYIPYYASVILEDGEKLTFAVWWMKDEDVDHGVYTEYGAELVRHYADKYNLDYQVTTTYIHIDVDKAELSGDYPVLNRFLDELWGSAYVKSGQQISLYIDSEVGYSYSLDTSSDKEIPYKEMYRELTAVMN